jgi:excisionase family DNA binding protein
VTDALAIGQALADALRSLEERIARLEERDRERDGREWLTVDQAARLLSCTPEALRARARRGRIPSHRQGRSLYFRRSDVEGSVD